MRKCLLLLIPTMFLCAQFSDMEFPLQTGNGWQYVEGGGSHAYESKAFVDTTMPNGLTYTKIEGILFSGYYRKEGSRVFQYDVSAGTEELKYDFSLDVGDTLSVIIYDTDTTLITVTSKGTKTIFNEEKNYMTFLRDNLPSTADGEETVIDGIGFAQYSGEVFFYGLTGAIINGKTYGKITSITKDGSISNKFTLAQNYPNPFNPRTTIKFTIPSVVDAKFASTTAKIIVYDILGREIKTLLNKPMQPGNYEVEFDGTNLPSGVYFYRIIYDKFTSTKKMLLLK